MEIKYLNILPYAQALELMEKIHSEMVADETKEGVILVVQHPPTVTMGNRNLLEDMIVPPDQLKFKGVAYHKIDRGGSVTVHEPGQVVIYPIFSMLKYGHTVRSYVCALEQAMIDTCAHYGVKAARDSINPGVWVGENKIGAVGIRILNKVTKHGLAFNVKNSLETFQTIVPCGLRGRGVTSLEREVTGTVDKEKNPPQKIVYSEVEKILAEQILKLVLK